VFRYQTQALLECQLGILINPWAVELEYFTILYEFLAGEITLIQGAEPRPSNKTTAKKT
jgi:hypothetical protein